jgi:phosphoglycolate phosphatase
MSRNMPKFILFDIDGTLIHSGGAGKEAMNNALEDLTGVKAGFQDIECAGKTDLTIFYEGFAKAEIDADDGFIDRFNDSYLVHLRSAVSSCVGHVKPGVVHLLTRLEKENGFVLGLLTGNLERGARIKLGRFDLNRFFSLGAFGDDDANRNRLLPVATGRLKDNHGIDVDYSECIVIGDTPRDVEAAAVHGAACIAVATGPYSVEYLTETGADLVVEDLADTERIVIWIKDQV